MFNEKHDTLSHRLFQCKGTKKNVSIMRDIVGKDKLFIERSLRAIIHHREPQNT